MIDVRKLIEGGLFAAVALAIAAAMMYTVGLPADLLAGMTGALGLVLGVLVTADATKDGPGGSGGNLGDYTGGAA